MKKNMGSLDRTLRLIAAVIMIGLYSMNMVEGTTGVVLLVLGVVFIITSLLSFCPLYLPFGLNTCSKKQ